MKRDEVERCPYCDEEIILQHDVENTGFKVRCQYCGEEIMLCDACLHKDDNQAQRCDWDPQKGCFRCR